MPRTTERSFAINPKGHQWEVLMKDGRVEVRRAYFDRYEDAYKAGQTFRDEALFSRRPKSDSANLAKGGRKPSGLPAAILQALRAGPLYTAELYERFPNPSQEIHQLTKAGWVCKIGHDGFEITDLGRRACPPRNPASARPRPVPRQGEHVRGPSPQPPGQYRMVLP